MPPLDPRGPLGGPRLLEYDGGPRLPELSNWGFVACSTLIGLPSKDFPFISRAASFASAGLSNVTNAKPLDLFVSRSFIRSTSTILPYLLKYCSKALSVVSVFSPPMNSLPGRSASAILFVDFEPLNAQNGEKRATDIRETVIHVRRRLFPKRQEKKILRSESSNAPLVKRLKQHVLNLLKTCRLATCYKGQLRNVSSVGRLQ